MRAGLDLNQRPPGYEPENDYSVQKLRDTTSISSFWHKNHKQIWKK